MPPNKQPSSTVWDYQPEPEVCWHTDGLDSMAWADGIPYAELADDTKTTADTMEAKP